MVHLAVAIISISIISVLYYVLTNERTEEPFSNTGYSNINRNASNCNKKWNSNPKIDKKYSQHTDDCSICLDTLKSGIKITLKPCFHVFHSRCIRTWERASLIHSCPNCRGRYN